MRAFAKAFSAAALAAALFMAPGRVAHAQVVSCPLCSNALTQTAQLAKEVASYEVQAQELTSQLQSYALLYHNTEAIPVQVWDDAQNDIAVLHTIMNGSTMLGGNAGAILGRLGNLPAYTSQLGSIGNMENQFQQWGSTNKSALTGLTSALGLTANTQASDAAIVAQMEAKASSATGQMQAIQAGAMFGASTTSQLMKLNQLTAMSMQFQGDRLGVDADRQAAQDAKVGAFLVNDGPASTGNPRY